MSSLWSLVKGLLDSNSLHRAPSEMLALLVETTATTQASFDVALQDLRYGNQSRAMLRYLFHRLDLLEFKAGLKVVKSPLSYLPPIKIKASIEHICPQKPESADWAKWSNDDRRDLLNGFGNLCLGEFCSTLRCRDLLISQFP